MFPARPADAFTMRSVVIGIPHLQIAAARIKDSTKNQCSPPNEANVRDWYS